MLDVEQDGWHRQPVRLFYRAEIEPRSRRLANIRARRRAPS
jgi:hypothetical protein